MQKKKKKAGLKKKSNPKPVNGVTYPSGPNLPGFTIEAAVLSAEQSCYHTSKTSFRSRKNVMTEKDIHYLASYFHFLRQKATTLGCSVWQQYLATFSTTTWHMILTVPFLSHHGAKSKLSEPLQVPLCLRHTPKKIVWWEQTKISNSVYSYSNKHKRQLKASNCTA